MSEMIGPNSCSSCGGEYGEHRDWCEVKQQQDSFRAKLNKMRGKLLTADEADQVRRKLGIVDQGAKEHRGDEQPQRPARQGGEGTGGRSDGMSDDLDQMDDAALSEAVAVELMGWNPGLSYLCRDRERRGMPGPFHPVKCEACDNMLSEVPRFASDPAAMMDVVDRLHAGGECLTLTWVTGCTKPLDKFQWQAFARMSGAHAHADTMPRAVAIATLRAVRVFPCWGQQRGPASTRLSRCEAPRGDS